MNSETSPSLSAVIFALTGVCAGVAWVWVLVEGVYTAYQILSLDMNASVGTRAGVGIGTAMKTLIHLPIPLALTGLLHIMSLFGWNADLLDNDLDDDLDDD